MKFTANTRTICILAATVLAVPGISQIPGELTTGELNIQRLYIEASQAKLLGANDEAAEIYKEILNQDNQNHAAAYEYSRVLYSLERYREALDQVNTALRYGPENSWYWLMKADILEVLEDYAGAIDVYSTLVKMKPDERYYYLHQVDLLLETQQPEKALDVLTQLETRRGIEPEVMRKKVEILDHLGLTTEALTEIERLLRFYPDDMEFLHLAGVFAVDAGMTEKATEIYNRILAIDPDDAAANLYAASKYKSSGEDVDYLRSILPLIQNPDIDVDAKVSELIPYIEKYSVSPSREYGEVLGEVIAELVRQHDDEAKVHALYGDYLYASNDLPGAVAEYEKTLVLDKSVFDVWEQLMYIKAEMYDMDGLLRTSEQALNVFPNQATIYYLRGLAYGYKDDHESALTELQQALIMTGRNTDLRFHVLHLLGQVYLDMGNTAKAFEGFDKALELRPDDLTLIAQYSMALVDQGADLNKAEELAKKAIKLSPDNPQVEHTLALIAYKRGDFKKAYEYIDLSLDHGGGDDPQILEHTGDILYSLDQVDEAVEYWQLSLDAGNSSPTLKRKITERKIIH